MRIQARADIFLYMSNKTMNKAHHNRRHTSTPIGQLTVQWARCVLPWHRASYENISLDTIFRFNHWCEHVNFSSKWLVCINYFRCITPKSCLLLPFKVWPSIYDKIGHVWGYNNIYLILVMLDIVYRVSFKSIHIIGKL